jgi:hypothetical protein
MTAADPVVDEEFEAEWPSKCPDCGRRVLSNEQRIYRYRRIKRGLRDRRLVVPSGVYEDLDELEADAVCRAGQCVPGVAA